MFEKFKHYSKFAIIRIKISLQNSMEFKFDFIASIFAEIIYMILTYFIATLFINAIPNFGLTAIQLFIYTQTLVIIFTIQNATKSQIMDSIKDGTLNLDLIRPINIIYQSFWNSFGTKTIIIQILKFIFIIGYILIFSNINIGLYILLTIVVTIISTIFANAIFYLLRSYDLKKIQAGSFFHRITNEGNISNYITTYPIYLLPKFMLVYSSFFSLYYIANTTLDVIYSANITNIVLLLGAEIVLTIIFMYFANLAWKKMLKYYEGFGG